MLPPLRRDFLLLPNTIGPNGNKFDGSGRYRAKADGSRALFGHCSGWSLPHQTRKEHKKKGTGREADFLSEKEASIVRIGQASRSDCSCGDDEQVTRDYQPNTLQRKYRKDRFGFSDLAIS